MRPVWLLQAIMQSKQCVHPPALCQFEWIGWRACRCMESLGMWEDVLSIVDDEIGGDEGRLFVRDESWDGSQYIRCHLLIHFTRDDFMQAKQALLNPVCVSAYLAVRLSGYLPVFYLAACLSVCLSAFCLSAYLPSCLPVCLFDYCLAACLPICLSAYLPICLSAYLPVCICTYLPECLPMHSFRWTAEQAMTCSLLSCSLHSTSVRRCCAMR